jgi:hypothetical protein
MKLSRLLASLALVAVLAGVAYVGQVAEPRGVKMVSAADAFLASLTPEQRAKTTFAFDDKERTNWFFIPLQDKETRRSTRKGLPLEQMSPEQKQAALALVKAGTSADGFEKARTIMSLENILREQEKQGAMVRNPEWYFFTIFGKPSQAEKWGWRVDGHHLALNFTLEGAKVVSGTPNFFGANPATVKYGPKQGYRTLPSIEDLAWQLFKALDPEQKEVARQKEQFPEIEQGKPAPNVGAPKGLAAEKMTQNQRGILVKLLQAYTDRMPPEVGARELSKAREAGIEKIHFAYAGSTQPGQPHTYRVQGPTFVVEFLNSQADSAKNPANHIHSAWRNMKGDFGLSQESRLE